MVLLKPALVGDFDGDAGVGFALSDEPFLLLWCEGVRV